MILNLSKILNGNIAPWLRFLFLGFIIGGAYADVKNSISILNTTIVIGLEKRIAVLEAKLDIIQGNQAARMPLFDLWSGKLNDIEARLRHLEGLDQMRDGNR